MRWISILLFALILLWQYPLWLGKGSWFKVWEVDRQLEAQRKVNQQTEIRNSVLDAEVRDLKQGTEAIEERARSDLGMIKPDEVFFQVVGETASIPASAVYDIKPANH